MILAFGTTTVLSSGFLAGSGGWMSPARFRAALADPLFWHRGLSFSIPFFLILTAHEAGHWLAARRHRLDASLPWFLPLPVGIGSAGAFIRIRERFRNRTELFDVGVAGPIAGFAVALPVLAAGVLWSRPGEGFPAEGTPFFGDTLLTAAVVRLVPTIAHAPWVAWHPTAWAGWFGLFLTALNLLPMGQLDGGHALYAVSPAAHRRLGIAVAAGLLGLSIATWQPVWAIWGLLGLTGFRRHPELPDEATPLDARRRRIAWLVLAIFLLSFTPDPLFEIVAG